jgi:DNA repair exonuclease SbcCD ATPase subunit
VKTVSKISAVEKGRINKERYAEYIAELEATGKKFPLNQFGEVNLTDVANACGFNRQVFSRNASMKAQFEEDIRRIGTEIHKGVDKETRLEKKATEKAKVASKLQKELDAQVQENHSLRNQIDVLQSRVRELEGRENEMEMSMDELLTSGRRFSL